MLKKYLLMGLGISIFIIGVILFPIPVPLGLPTMLIGLAVMFKASNRVKRLVIRTSIKYHYTNKLWQQIKAFRYKRKLQSAKKMSVTKP